MNATFKKGYLFFTLFITGAAIMVLELIGTRVIAPIYGGGLFVWASLITVALTCLSIGYLFGGKIADLKPDFRIFYLIILAAGILIAPIPQISQPILRWSIKLGFRAGALASAYLLFTVPMVLLGMVSPYAVRLATTELNVLGTTAGRLYAISTLGSFVGTLLCGFVLIPNLGIKKILFLQSSILILLWVGYYFVNKKYIRGLVSMVLLGLPILCASGRLFPESGSNDLKLIYKAESFYGQIKVFEGRDHRSLRVNNITQSSIQKYTYLPDIKIPYCFEILPLFNRKGTDACLIGLAGGSVPRRLWEYGIKTDSVEIDPEMEYIARKYFGFLDYFGKIYIDDGRTFMNTNKKEYDFVIIDVFTGDDIPFHLVTRESFREVKSIMRQDGILGINFIGELYGKDSLGWKSIYKTLAQIFSQVKVYSFLKGAESMDSVANIFFFASDAELHLPEDFKSYCRSPISAQVIELLAECELETNFSQGIVLTDDYSPIEFLRKNVSYGIRQRRFAQAAEGYFLD